MRSPQAPGQASSPFRGPNGELMASQPRSAQQAMQEGSSQIGGRSGVVSPIRFQGKRSGDAHHQAFSTPNREQSEARERQSTQIATPHSYRGAYGGAFGSADKNDSQNFAGK